MRVLMFGWEFPPQISGGLGVACEGLVRGLLQSGAEVALVLPRYPHRKSSGRLRILEALAHPDEPTRPPAAALRVRRIETALRPYGASSNAEPIGDTAAAVPEAAETLYGPNLASEVLRYAGRAAEIARRERFDVIHAHDWMTFSAGLEARRVSGKPLVVHVHATEYDRAGDGGNPFVREIEREGVTRADRVIAVSRYTAGVRRPAPSVAGRPQRDRWRPAAAARTRRRRFAARPLRRPRHVAEGARVLRRGGRARRPRDAGGAIRSGRRR